MRSHISTPHPIQKDCGNVFIVERNPSFFRVGSFGTRFANPADQEKVQQGLRKAGF